VFCKQDCIEKADLVSRALQAAAAASAATGTPGTPPGSEQPAVDEFAMSPADRMLFAEVDTEEAARVARAKRRLKETHAKADAGLGYMYAGSSGGGGVGASTEEARSNEGQQGHPRLLPACPELEGRLSAVRKMLVAEANAGTSGGGSAAASLQPHHIMTNVEIARMAREQPITQEALLQAGFRFRGERFVRYGGRVLQAINEFRRGKGLGYDAQWARG